MKIHLAITIHVDRERPPPDPPRETQLDALVDHAADQPDAPRIGFRSIEEER